ncbi:MAG TPA: cell wall-binding repeat-containing protein [Acidimicrobiales bacterium]|nr:cell wall-binding repeat-containing protein [Acidimicrobiales bacterium]
MKSIRGASALLLALALVSTGAITVARPASASVGEAYSGTHFGTGNVPEPCRSDPKVEEMSSGIQDLDDNATKVALRERTKCHHMRADLGGLDSPQIDVLVLVPASPVAERDMRIMRQAVEMWEGGIHQLAEEMGLFWLADGVDFHVTLRRVDPVTGEVDEFSPQPISDPEIVVIAANDPSFVTFGIGIDPLDTYGGIVNADDAPCLPVDNPFDFEQWNAVPGFDNHHGESGTYNEDCKPEETGGNVCFSINTTTDPAPDLIEIGNMFDLVSHEVGHCLSVGHVGDGAEGKWGGLPSNDIMAYSSDPPERTKCVSTLDVETFAVRMSRYLDTDGIGGPGTPTDLLATNVAMDDGNPFQIQQPSDHLYASTTGSPMDCPQPDVGPLPGPREDWTPQAPAPRREVGRGVTITAPSDGAASEDGVFNVTGVVQRVSDVDPTSPNNSYDDADDDAMSPMTEIKSLAVKVTNTHVEATIAVAQLWPSTTATSPVSYSVIIDGRQFDSFVRYPIDSNPMTWDTKGGPDTPDAAGGTGGYMPAGTSTWDVGAGTVSFKIPIAYLENDGAAATPAIETPFFVSSSANFGFLSATRPDDRAPDGPDTLGVAGGMRAGVQALPLGGLPAGSVAFDDGGSPANTFFPQDSSLGFRTKQIFPSPLGSSEVFGLDLPAKSDVTIKLGWTNEEDLIGLSDLDLYVFGSEGADPGEDVEGNTTGDNPEVIVLKNQTTDLTLEVDPYMITNDLGVTYTLTAVVTPLEGGGGGALDTDGDGILDATDQCDTVPGPAPSGCPPAATDADGDGFPDTADACKSIPGPGPRGCPEMAELWVGGGLAASDPVDTSDGRDRFTLPVGLAPGTHEATVKWVSVEGEELDRASITLTHTVPRGGGGATRNADSGGADGGGGGTGGAGAPTPVDRPAPGTRPPGATPVPEGAIEEAILTRVQGDDRIDTSIAASRAAFTRGSAEVAVLARSDRFADGLAGTSLGVAYGGPLLLTPGTGLEPRVSAELDRALSDGAEVFVLGGPAALPLEIDAQLKAAGFRVTRLAGADRFETAALVARAQPRHSTILVATGQNFADALAAGAAAAEARGTVVLTDDGSLPKATADYLAEHPSANVIAIGGPAASALPGAESIVGPDRFATSVRVAERFFSAPRIVGLASGLSFPDALSGGALLGRFRGPLVLTAPDAISPVVLDYLNRHESSIDDLFVMGGEAAVARPVVEDALEALRT